MLPQKSHIFGCLLALALPIGALPIGVLSGAGSAAAAEEALVGPVPAEVVRVIDGDTIEVRARIWLGQTVETRVRLAAIDTPEMRGGCPDSLALAIRARDRVETLVANRAVTLLDIRYDRYGGRVLARVQTADGIDISAALLESGLAYPYSGEGPRHDWCGVAALPQP